MGYRRVAVHQSCVVVTAARTPPRNFDRANDDSYTPSRKPAISFATAKASGQVVFKIAKSAISGNILKGSKTDSTWVCCQLGAREHYAVPRALQLSGRLREFLTDLWIRPAGLTHHLKHKLAGRFHPSLAGARVTAPNTAALAFELKSQAAGLRGWDLIGKRNDWFQRNVVTQLARRAPEQQPVTIFAYSYAADRIFELARERGWRTVMGQIDPGPGEARIVARLHESGTGIGNGWKPAPARYWRTWRRECELADRIVVNSNWSRNALLSEGVPAEKIVKISLAFEVSEDARDFERQYPARFTRTRPLRVLFLGQINLRKGVAQLLDAARLLANEPVEFWFVGPRQVLIPRDLNDALHIRWFGAVARAKVDTFYRDADVFILPTFSDGFGLTQLEAQSWKLPVIASRFCGEVVEHGHNGLILEDLSGEAITNALGQLLREPDRLAAMSRESYVADQFSLPALASSLANL